MRMLEEDQTEDQEVTLPDQTNINAFSKLNNRTEELSDLLQSLKRELEELEEVETEIELMDEEELVMYKLDSSLLHLPAARVLTLLQESLEVLREKNTTLEAEREECEEGMTKLKGILYAKFGKSINLEK